MLHFVEWKCSLNKFKFNLNQTKIWNSKFKWQLLGLVILIGHSDYYYNTCKWLKLKVIEAKIQIKSIQF